MGSVIVHSTQFIQSVSTDVLLVVGILLALFFYGLYQGTPKLGSILVSMYLGTLIYIYFPYLNKFVLVSAAISHIMWWTVFFGLAKLIVDRVVNIPASYSRMRNMIDIGLLSASVFAVGLVVGYALLSLGTFYTPSIISLNLISTTTDLFWTIVGSMVILFGIVFF